MKNKKGISLIILAITIIVMAILVTVTVTGMSLATSDAKLTTFASELQSIEESIAVEYALSAKLPTTSEIPYTQDDILSLLNTEMRAKLLKEITSHKDEESRFYLVDLKQIGVTKTKRGAAKTKTDIYIVSEKSMRVYYVKGVADKGKTYFSLTKELSKLTNIALENTQDAENVVIGDSIKAIKEQKSWTNKIDFTIVTAWDNSVSVKLVLPNRETVDVTAEAKNGKVQLSLDKYTAAQLTGKEVVFEKWGARFGSDSSVIKLDEDRVNIENLDIVAPVLLKTSCKTIKRSKTMGIEVNATDDLSQIGRIRYYVLSKVVDNELVTTAESNVSDKIDAVGEERKQIQEFSMVHGKVADSNKFSLDKNIYHVRIIAEDKAGNFSDYVDIIENEDLVLKPGIPSVGPLIPVKWDSLNNEYDTTREDTNWFDYSAKKWANARTEDHMAYFTWIPRYAYRIIYYDKPVVDNQAPAGGNIVGYSDNRGLVDANGNASTTFNRLNGRVEVEILGRSKTNLFKWLEGKKYVGDVRVVGTADNPRNLVVHPAFSAVRRKGYTKRDDGNFGNTEEIPGFWVSKFEMGPDSVSKPNISAQRNMSISDMFTLGRNLAAKRGITGGDSNAMTNTQWGAVAYLTKGLGKEPDVNINTSYITANGDYKANANQSTTGNTTGVYDMSGCGWDTMPAYVNGGTLTTGNGQNLITNKDTKYVDVYAAASRNTKASNYAANADKYGDAIYEVSSNGDSSPRGWSGDYSYFPGSTSPVFYRGGIYLHGGRAGVFAFDSSTGQPHSDHCWRRCLHFMTSVPFFPFIYSKQINTTEKIE